VTSLSLFRFEPLQFGDEVSDAERLDGIETIEASQLVMRNTIRFQLA
jgi:hypothetical protein